MPEPTPTPEGYRGSSKASRLSDLEIECVKNAAFVHTSALTFARIAFEDIRERESKGEKVSLEEAAQPVQFLAKAGALAHAVHVFMLQPNSEEHLKLVATGLDEVSNEDLSDVFEDKLNAFADQLLSLNLQRRLKRQAQRLSKN